jgi:uncharacterized protein (TIGR02271 family)
MMAVGFAGILKRSDIFGSYFAIHGGTYLFVALEETNMETARRTVLANFDNIEDARAAISELRNIGYQDVRLIENDAHTYSHGHLEKEGGVKGFFARLFGFEDERSTPTHTLGSETEAHFRGAYESRKHVVVVSQVTDLSRCLEIIEDYDGVVEKEGAQLYERAYAGSNYQEDQSSERVLELREEQLEVGKERVQSGEVNLRKEVITEMRTVEVPVTREEIVVERRALDGIARDGEISMRSIGETEEIRIPVSEEHIHVEKKVVPREEVRVSKQRITETETVSEEVRREEARIESEGRVNVSARGETLRSTNKNSKDFDQPSI